jgi:MFS family permease
VLASAFLGAILLSRLADRLGRRNAFYLTLGVYSVFSVLAAFSPNGRWRTWPAPMRRPWRSWSLERGLGPGRKRTPAPCRAPLTR